MSVRDDVGQIMQGLEVKITRQCVCINDKTHVNTSMTNIYEVILTLYSNFW